MEKDFVTYEQALALKELGFNETCLGCYLYEVKTFTWELNYRASNNDIQWVKSAPLKSQVFRWFREKYNYDISIRGASFRANWVIGVPLLINNDSKDGYPLVISWDYKISDGMKVLTYEEAESACIDKLI